MNLQQMTVYSHPLEEADSFSGEELGSFTGAARSDGFVVPTGKRLLGVNHHSKQLSIARTFLSHSYLIEALVGFAGGWMNPLITLNRLRKIVCNKKRVRISEVAGNKVRPGVDEFPISFQS